MKREAFTIDTAHSSASPSGTWSSCAYVLVCGRASSSGSPLALLLGAWKGRRSHHTRVRRPGSNDAE
jgi:hypothetical protein